MRSCIASRMAYSTLLKKAALSYLLFLCKTEPEALAEKKLTVLMDLHNVKRDAAFGSIPLSYSGVDGLCCDRGGFGVRT